MFCTQLFTCHPSESSRLNLFCSCTHLPLPGATKMAKAFSLANIAMANGPFTIHWHLIYLLKSWFSQSAMSVYANSPQRVAPKIAEPFPRTWSTPRVGQPQLWPHKAPQTLPIQSVDWVGRIHPSLLKLILSQFAILLGSLLSMGILRVTSVLCHSGP